MKADGFGIYYWKILVAVKIWGYSSSGRCEVKQVRNRCGDHYSSKGPKGDRTIYRVVGRVELGSSTLQQEIGLGKCNKIQSIKIYWPS
ncbi:hypothetical protein Ct9H90mP29_23400 [bacterium]|nr:MAG: hypothetical protein Ct9H90mP29_23400 [bacterium]